MGYIYVDRRTMEDPNARSLIFRYLIPMEVQFHPGTQDFSITGSSGYFRSLSMGDTPPRYEIVRNTDEGGVDTLTFAEVT
jgi:hypothetical protein